MKVTKFLYADIYEEGTVECVQAPNDLGDTYYEKMDAIKEQDDKE